MIGAHIEPPPPMHAAEPSAEAKVFFGEANFLVAKLTDYCNLKCTYCHQDALTGKPILMPIETFKNAVRLILGSSRMPRVSVQFHGGEPLLASDDFFREAVAFCREYLGGQGKQVDFYIQTNLTRVDPQREALLKDLKIGISFSLDGPPEINEEMRGGSRRILDNWRRMKTNGNDAGMICLIQPSNWDRMEEVINFFDEEGMHTMRFNLMVPDGRGKEVDNVPSDKLFNAKAMVMDYMLATQGKRMVDMTLEKAMKRFAKANGAPSTFEYHGCESLYCQAGRSLYSFNPDGSFYACDRIAEYPVWAMGSVNKEFGSTQHVVAKKQRSAFHHKDEWWARCEGCDAKKICEFSCSAYYVHEVDTREIECQYTKKLWALMLERREEILKFVGNTTDRVFIDDKKPKEEVREAKRPLKEIAADLAYNEINSAETIAHNKSFQLLKRGEQYFLYVYARKKMFEVDNLIAEIARFNGALSGDLVENLLDGRFEKQKLKDALVNLQKAVPELIAARPARAGLPPRSRPPNTLASPNRR